MRLDSLLNILNCSRKNMLVRSRRMLCMRVFAILHEAIPLVHKPYTCFPRHVTVPNCCKFVSEFVGCVPYSVSAAIDGFAGPSPSELMISMLTICCIASAATFCTCKRKPFDAYQNATMMCQTCLGSSGLSLKWSPDMNLPWCAPQYACSERHGRWAANTSR